MAYQYKAYRDLTPEQKRRANCRAYAKTYLRRGKITKAPCEKCADPKVEMHHDDYSKPLQVRWLCRKCHMDHHQQRGDLRWSPSIPSRHPVTNAP